MGEVTKDMWLTVAGEVVALKTIVVLLLAEAPELHGRLAEMLGSPLTSADNPIGPYEERARDEWRRRIIDGRLPPPVAKGPGA